MPYLIGTDEAGYGPNLGPLVIGATSWWIPSDSVSGDLYELLKDVLTGELSTAKLRRSNSQPATIERVPIADSKLLYRPGGELALLELGLLVAMEQQGKRPTRFRELIESVCPSAGEHLEAIPWYHGFDLEIPSAPIGQIRPQCSSQWRTALKEQAIRLDEIRARIIYPEEFNRGVAQHDSKGAVLSRATLDLIEEVLDQLPDDDHVEIICDKHGGRNKYGGLLQGRFGTGLVRVVTEGRALSRYEVGDDKRSIQISFQVGGESHLPSALASMLAKYVRELSMKAFNRFWQQHVSNLKPTAGYPLDAKRFRAEIRSAQQMLNIDDRVLWRNR